MRNLEYYTEARRMRDKAISDWCKGRISTKNMVYKIKRYFKIEHEKFKDIFEEIKSLNKKVRQLYIKQLNYQF